MTTTTTKAPKPAQQGVSLKATVFGLMLAGALIPLGLSSAISYGNAKEEIVTFANSNLLKDNASNAKTVQSWIAGNDQAVRAAAQAAEVGAMDPAAIREFLVKVNAELPVFYAVVVAGPDGTHIARSDNNKLINVADRSYFKQPLAGAPSAIMSANSKINGRTSFYVGVPVRNQQRDIVGVMAAHAWMDQITSKITGAKIGASGFSYLVGTDGIILAHPDVKKVGTQVPDTVKPLMGADSQGRVTNQITPENVDVKITASSAGTDLVLISQIDQAEIDQPLKAVQRSTLLFLLGALGLTVVLSWLLANGIASKINSLSKIAEQISKARSEMDLTDLEKKIDNVGGAREIRSLSQAIKRLSSSIRLSMRSM